MEYNREKWAYDAATMVLENHENAAAISTANYIECGFIIAAARMCRIDPAFAEAVGRLMEPPRSTEDDSNPLDASRKSD